VKKLVACLAFAALAACGSEQPAPAPTQAAAVPAPVASPSMPAPDQDVFAATYAEGCPKAEKVATSVCKSEGLGKDGFVCEYRLGSEDAARRTTGITPGDGTWKLADPDTACAADNAA
jgi:hypothetical protein